MIRFTFLSAILLLSSSIAMAQQLDASWDLPEEKLTVQRIGNDVQDFEIGLGAGFATPLKLGSGMKLEAEARYNIVGSPWDLGLQYSALFVESPKYGIKFTSGAMYSAHVDYNWRNWNNIAPFAGLGAGYYNGEYLNPNNALGHDGTTTKASNAFLSFRGGCEFWDHLRITAEYRLFFGGTPSVILLGALQGQKKVFNNAKIFQITQKVVRIGKPIVSRFVSSFPNTSTRHENRRRSARLLTD